MARIAYIDHSYHRTTRSTVFLRDMLRRRGHEVFDFWDEAWRGGAPVGWSTVEAYDIVIMFQSYCALANKAFRQAHPNVIYIPMLDQFGIWQGAVSNQAAFWEPFQGSKVLSFSNALHCLVTGFGVVSHRVRYFQPAHVQNENKNGLRGFFWVRRQDQINWALIKKLIGNSKFENFHIHLASDPGSQPPELPTAEEKNFYNITTSTWFDDHAELSALIDRANIYFAPRMEEGIGQSFLEAMAKGKCVVAANQGTMNEYIIHGVNGLLFDHLNPRPLDFSRVHQLGATAHATVVTGHAEWIAAESAIVDFILTPSEELYAGKYQHAYPTETLLGSTYDQEPCQSLEPSQAAPIEKSFLQSVSQQYLIFRKTRWIWHPLVRIARHAKRASRRV